MFCKKGVLSNFTGKHLCEFFLIKLQALACNVIKKGFPVNFVKFLRTPFLQNVSVAVSVDMTIHSN